MMKFRFAELVTCWDRSTCRAVGTMMMIGEMLGFICYWDGGCLLEYLTFWLLGSATRHISRVGLSRPTTATLKFSRFFVGRQRDMGPLWLNCLTVYHDTMSISPTDPKPPTNWSRYLGELDPWFLDSLVLRYDAWAMNWVEMIIMHFRVPSTPFARIYHMIDDKIGKSHGIPLTLNENLLTHTC